MPSDTRSWSLVGDLKWRQLGLLAILWLAGAAVSTLFIVHETDEMFDNAMAEAANAVLAFETQPNLLSGPASAEKLALSGDRRKYLSFQIRDGSGQVLARSSKAPIEPYPVSLQPGFVGRGSMRYLTRAIPGTSRVVQVAEYYDERRDAFLGLLAGLTIPLVILLAVGGLLLSRSIGRVAQPIKALGQQLQLRSGANLQLIENAGMPQELAPIVDDMNRLLSRLNDAFEAERAFSANCAHELRNPIASAKAQIEYVSRFPNDASNERRLKSIGSSLNDLGHRIERLLQLSRAQSGAALASSNADLIGVTRLLVDDFVLRGRSVTFDPGDKDSLIVAIDADAAGIAVQNLIDNAVAHSDSGARVDVHIDGSGALHIINSCAAIAPDVLARLPERFYRDRTAKSAGHGLGLAIVGELVRQANGTLELRSPAADRSDGFEAIMALPLAVSGEADAKMTTAAKKVRWRINPCRLSQSRPDKY